MDAVVRIGGRLFEAGRLQILGFYKDVALGMSPAHAAEVRMKELRMTDDLQGLTREMAARLYHEVLAERMIRKLGAGREATQAMKEGK